jgi:hypothetical protein
MVGLSGRHDIGPPWSQCMERRPLNHAFLAPHGELAGQFPTMEVPGDSRTLIGLVACPNRRRPVIQIELEKERIQ